MWFLPLLNIFAVSVVLIITVYGFVVHYYYTRAKRLMPEVGYPEGLILLFGHIFTFLPLAKTTATLRSHMNRYASYYKNGFFCVFGHEIWLFAVDQHMLQEVFSSVDAVEKSYVYQTLNHLTDGVFIAPAFRWKKLRKALNPTFRIKQLDAFMDAINDRIKIYLDINVKSIAEQKNFVDIQPYIARCFFDIVTKTHFGVDTDDQLNAESKITEKTSKAVDEVFEKRFLSPHLHPNIIFQFTKLHKKMMEDCKEPLAYIENMIERRLKILDEHKSDESDHLVFIDQIPDLLKELNIETNITNLQKNTGDILIAGSDTPAVAAAATLYHLALNKDIQEKVYEEVSKYCGQDSYKPLTRQEINSMTYLDMVVNEGIRWSAPTGVVRFIKDDFDAGCNTIPKGTNVFLLMSPQHLNPDYFERPYEFYPEHFAPEVVKARPKMAFVPFSSGPRNCPGQTFAYIVIKAATAVIINKYHLETNLPLEEVDLKIVLMSQHAQGYPIRFTPRHPKHTSD